jgi:very-short-patch-repair endonuclease
MRPSDHTPWQRVAEIAVNQHGLVTTRQLTGCDLHPRAIPRAVESGRLFRVHQTVYAVGRPPSNAYERVMAAALACGPTALVSHVWALWLYGLARLPNRPIDITVTDKRDGPKGVRLHRCRSGLRTDRQNGIPVTTPARTLIDCIPHLTAKHLRRATSDVQIDGLTSVDAIREELERTKGRRIEPLARLVAEDVHEITRSALEDILLDLSRKRRWPKPRVNHTVLGYEVDFAYPQWRLVIEADSFTFHGTKIAFEDDHQKWLDLESGGQRVIPISYAQVVHDRRRTTARLERIFEGYAI